MYYVMRASAPSLHRESTDSLIQPVECGGGNVHYVLMYSWYAVGLL